MANLLLMLKMEEDIARRRAKNKLTYFKMQKLHPQVKKKQVNLPKALKKDFNKKIKKFINPKDK